MATYDSWSRLSEVWLGDCYPKKFYDHLGSEVKECFHKITEITQEDLLIIQKKLEEFDIRVKRPTYNNIEDYSQDGNLMKPQITPRDYYFSLGDKLYFKDNYKNFSLPWVDVVNEYKESGLIEITDRLHHDLHIGGANLVRVGRDLFFDLHDKNMISLFETQALPKFKDYRCHLIFNGGHTDSCFAILKPGLILASNYYEDYAKTFPGWQSIYLDKPEFYKNPHPSNFDQHNKNWWLPTGRNDSFNEHIVKYALDWVGDYTETYFDINCLVIDERNVLMLGDNDNLYNQLEKKGISVHQVPFRTRTFWDGGLHCLTVDIRRNSKLQDYFDFKDPLIIHQ
jgi:hypothetical protein